MKQVYCVGTKPKYLSEQFGKTIDGPNKAVSV